MKNRRNYYRILHVQPDAPETTIKNNYRTLMQKLKSHPDLGGDDWSASLINVAYATLRHPAKRAEYDRQLLRRYHIGTLSQGPHHTRPRKTGSGDQGRKSGVNQRSYYRLLQVQPDAPAAVIETSYRSLLRSVAAPRALLDEAWKTLGNPETRAQYDRFLRGNSHTRAVRMLAAESAPLTVPQTRRQSAEKRKPVSPPPSSPQHAIITSYCAFCKTPFAPGRTFSTTGRCIECASPLSRLPPAPSAPAHRALRRAQRSGQLVFYPYWPAKPFPADLEDLSPTGLQLTTAKALLPAAVIKIEGEQLEAVGEVVYQRPHGPGQYTVGVRFMTVLFPNQAGNFVAVSA